METRKIKMKRFILILVTTVHTTFFTILQKLFILRFIVTLLLVCPLYVRAPSLISNFPLARQNFTIALLPFLFLSATGFKNFPSVSRTSIRYCSSSTACVYFFLIQNIILISSEMTTRKIKMKRFILILLTTVHTTFFTILQKLFILRCIGTLLLVCRRTCSICILCSYRND